MGDGDELDRLFADATTADRHERDRVLGLVRRNLVGVDEPAPSLSRYVLLEPLGHGGMGVVHLAFDPTLDRRVAIKLIPDWTGDGRDRNRLLDEARAAAALSHPNIVAIFDVGLWGREPNDGATVGLAAEVSTDDDEGRTPSLAPSGAGVYIVMELFEGDSLQSWLQTPRPWREVLEKFIAAGRGLAAAHDAGIVHRDFKPGNVLIGRDGRVCVADFGLALHVGDAGGPVVEDEPEPTAPMHATLADHAVGTPAYMAPEQHHGGHVDVRSDQFAFCASLYRGLYGRVPFEADGPDALLDAKLGTPVRFPSTPVVPPAISRAIARGLAGDPADRFASMRELLATLERPLQPVRRRRAMVVTACAAAAVMLSVLAIDLDEPSLCKSQERIGEVWNTSRAASMRDAFAATKLVYAEDSASRVIRALDAYTRGWAQRHNAACTSGGAKVAQGETTLDRTMSCLEERRTALAATVELLSRPDDELVSRAIDLAGSLPLLERCDDPSTLPASDPAHASTRALLTVARAQTQAGRLHASLMTAEYAATVARALDDPTLVAAAYLRRGIALEDLGRYEAALTDLEAAYVTASAAGDDGRAVLACSQNAFVLGADMRRHEDARRWVRQCDALLARGGARPDTEAKARTHLGAALAQAHDPEGRLQLERSVALHEEIGDREGLALALGDLGAALVLEGRPDEAVDPLREAVDIQEARLGPRHPALAMTLNTLAVTLAQSGRMDEAEHQLTRTREIWVDAVGPNHPDVATVDANLGNIALLRGDFTLARERFEEAIAIRERVLGEEDPGLAPPLGTLAKLMLDVDEPHAALEHARRAVELRERSRGYDDRELPATLSVLGAALLRLERTAEAVDALEYGVSLGPHDPDVLHGLRLNLAEALWRAGRDRDRARTLAFAAQQDADTPAAHAEAWAWLAAHPAPQ